MYRLMQPSDRAAVVALWQKERGDTAESMYPLIRQLSISLPERC